MNKEYNTVQFEKDLKEFGIELSEKQREQFILYYELLIVKNQVMNLTAITDYDEVMKKHFVDSVSLVRACDMKGRISVVDVGTGAGFPGLALKIVFPDLRVTLLDSLNKRVLFLKEVVEKLGLKEVTALHGRAEDLARQKELRERFDLCVSRAVANLSTLSEYCLPFVKVGGSFISYKSEKISEELPLAENAIQVLGGKIKDQVSFYLPDSDIYRNLFVVEKIKQTPKKFPRKAGIPGKEPL